MAVAEALDASRLDAKSARSIISGSRMHESSELVDQAHAAPVVAHESHVRIHDTRYSENHDPFAGGAATPEQATDPAYDASRPGRAR